MVKAVAFDFDGILADTEHIKMQSYIEAVETIADRKSGLSLVDLEPSVGFSEVEVASNVAKKSGIIKPNQIQNLIELKRVLYASKLESGGVAFFQDTLKLATLLHARGVKVGIVTGSDSDTVRKIFSKNKKDVTIFSIVVGREHVTKPKPNPDGYNLFIHEMNVTSAECLAIEDSQPGIAASCGANIETFTPERRYNLGVEHKFLRKFKNLNLISFEIVNRINKC